jgi:hypothetical protein
MTDNIKDKIEDKIIDLIALGSSGRLVVFKPEKINKDLIVEKRGDYKKKAVSLNIYEKEFSDSFGKEINPDEDFYLLFVNFDIVKQDINDNFLVVSSLEYEGAIKNGDFSKFVTNKKSFVSFLIEKLK